jgi:hypothetical protein
MLALCLSPDDQPPEPARKVMPNVAQALSEAAVDQLVEELQRRREVVCSV